MQVLTKDISLWGTGSLLSKFGKDQRSGSLRTGYNLVWIWCHLYFVIIVVIISVFSDSNDTSRVINYLHMEGAGIKWLNMYFWIRDLTTSHYGNTETWIFPFFPIYTSYDNTICPPSHTQFIQFTLSEAITVSLTLLHPPTHSPLIHS